MQIIANHAHLMPSPTKKSWWPKGDVNMLLQHLDYCEIDKVVVFPPFACQMNNDIIAANKWAWKEIDIHKDRLLAAGLFNPAAKEAKELLKIFRDEGIRSCKVHPSIDKHDISDPRFDEIYEMASEYDIAFDYHTGVHGSPLSSAKPEKFDDIAWKHPKLKLIFEHIGGRTYFEGFLAILVNHKDLDSKNRPRVYGGVTSILSKKNHDNLFWYLGIEKIEDVITFASSKKLIYGLDFPWNNKEINKEDITLIKKMNIPDSEKQDILGGNLMRLCYE